MHNGSIEQIAWSAGIRACEEGVPKDPCPYTDTGPQSAIDQWYEGYNLAASLIGHQKAPADATG